MLLFMREKAYVWQFTFMKEKTQKLSSFSKEKLKKQIINCIQFEHKISKMLWLAQTSIKLVVHSWRYLFMKHRLKSPDMY
mmetsp:Transcript_31979/g.47736  ORF Transcript_31979/g.47736 Transcript_31979/m.47736 type:complete len:80 (+) Transcript_31979:377-616(+)